MKPQSNTSDAKSLITHYLSLLWYAAAAIALLLIWQAAFAQDAPVEQPGPSDHGGGGGVGACLGIGVLISWAVAALKLNETLRNHPKAVATVLSVLVAAMQALAGMHPGDFWSLAVCVVAQLAGAIGAHELINKNLRRDEAARWPGAP